MKHLLAWILTGLWAVLLWWSAWGYLHVFSGNPGLPTIESLLAAIGAFVVGGTPLACAWWWHRYSQKRLHKTLTKQRDKLDRKLGRLGESKGAPPKRVEPAASPSEPAKSE